MKNKIVTLESNVTIYIADEVNYQNKKYVYGLQYDKLSENITEKYYILEVVINDNKISLSNIENAELKQSLYAIFTKRQLEEVMSN